MCAGDGNQGNGNRQPSAQHDVLTKAGIPEQHQHWLDECIDDARQAQQQTHLNVGHSPRSVRRAGKAALPTP